MLGKRSLPATSTPEQQRERYFQWNQSHIIQRNTPRTAMRDVKLQITRSQTAVAAGEAVAPCVTMVAISETALSDVGTPPPVVKVFSVDDVDHRARRSFQVQREIAGCFMTKVRDHEISVDSGKFRQQLQNERLVTPDAEFFRNVLFGDLASAEFRKQFMDAPWRTEVAHTGQSKFRFFPGAPEDAETVQHTFGAGQFLQFGNPA